MRTTSLKLFPWYLAGLAVMALFSWLLSLLYAMIPKPDEIFWLVHLLPAILFMVGAILSHKLSKGRSPGYILGYLCNAAGSGCAIGALLGTSAVLPPPELLIMLLPAAGLALVMCLLCLLPAEPLPRIIAILFTVLAVGLVVWGIVVWICYSSLAGCTMVFSGLFFLPFPIGCCFCLDKPRQKYRYLSFTGFGAFILIALVVVFFLSEGEILDGLDLPDFSTRGSKKMKK